VKRRSSALYQCAIVLVLLALALSSSAQEEPKKKPQGAQLPVAPGSQPGPADDTGPGQYPEALFKSMKWRVVGPYRGGRVLAVAGIPGDSNTYYFGAVAGGVFKSTNGGATWQPMFEHEHISSIGAIAVSESNPNIVYAGSGEACIRGNISYGDGVYKSTDGGNNWKNVGLRDSRHIGALIIDPRNPDRVFIAALGHAFGSNAERGVFRTTDGGATWQKVLFVDDKTGAIDVVFDPNNPSILFAAMWQVLRQPWNLSSGGPGSGLFKSIDGGNTWKRLQGNGLPEGIMGKIGVTVSGADSNRIYAQIEAKEGGLYRSEDAGDHWTRVNDDDRYRQRAWYFTHVFADPKSVDMLYMLNTGLFRSTDGGKTFSLLPAPHGDHHGLWIDPKDPNRIINSNDGGVTITVDGGKTWTRQNNQPTAQFYHIIADNRFPYYLYGAQQDNTTVAIASQNPNGETEGAGVIGREWWYDVGGGESGYIAPDPRDANIVYAGDNGGVLTRWDKRTGQEQLISVLPLDFSGHGASDFEHRFQWTEPVMLSPHNPDILYTAAEVVFKSTDHGNSWTAISPDLTRNDKSKQQPSGGPITKDITSVEYYDTVFALAESPVTANLLWAGTDDGLIHVTRDGGQHWDNVTPKAMPEWSLVSIIDASPHEAGTAYVAVDRHKLDDFKPYIFKTADYGKTWTQIANNIPDGSYVHAVREDPKRKGLLFAGTETGVYFSANDGAVWQPLQLNLPTSPIHDLILKNDDLAVATHGRSFWILDDIMPLRQRKPELASSDAFLYAPQVALRLHYPDNVDRRRPVGQDPPFGALIDYYLNKAHKDEITLDILDSQGRLVRHLSNKEQKNKFEQPPEWPDQEKPIELIPAEAGMNRFPWDLRYDPPVQVPGAFYAGNEPHGPLVMPGTYQLKLTVAGKSYPAPIEVKLDPRVKVSDADLQKQFELAGRTRDRIDELHRTINQLRDVRAQLNELGKRLGETSKAKPIIDAAQQLEKKMQPVELQMIQFNMKSSEGNLVFPVMLNEQWYQFNQTIDMADAAPTAQQLAVFDQLSKRTDTQLAQWREILKRDLPELNAMIRREDIPVIYVAPMESGKPVAAQ